jgi:hypothetical protein
LQNTTQKEVIYIGQREYDPGLCSGYPVRRAFNGAWYKLGVMDGGDGQFGTKKEAERTAKAYRADGYYVRTVKVAPGYMVYVRKKTLSYARKKTS